ncbi:MAG: radical SAM protein [Desulfosarcinaceae bacterium]|nr:radical SAM protein [Desulfosarcinaceae bacterium]
MAPKRPLLLIHPPVAKPCEPPAGVARLATALQAAGVPCRLFDASLFGLLDLLTEPLDASDTWTRRALTKRHRHLAALRSPHLYGHRERYRQAVTDLARLLRAAGRGKRIGLANYHDPDLSPVRSADLLRAAETYAENPFFQSFSGRLTRILAAFSPQVVGLSVNFMSQALGAFAIAGWLRRYAPRLRIVMGGGLVTSWGQIPGMGNPFGGLVDDLIEGPGERVLLDICAPGETLPETRSQFAGDLLPMSDYLAPRPILPYSTADGCWWRKCAFCPERAERQPYRPLAAAAIQKDLQRLTARGDAGLIHFLDDALAPRFLAHMGQMPPGMPWYGFARITDHLADPDFARALKRSGCVMLKLGIESGDQTVLDALNKGTRIALISKALHTLKAAGIGVYAYLLFGTPAETEPAARRTLAFTLAHSEAIDFLNLAIFNLPAYSPEARALKTRPFYPGDLSLYADFEHPGGWRRQRVRRFLAAVFKKPAPIRRILANDPPHFTSNHAPLLLMHSRQSA